MQDSNKLTLYHATNFTNSEDIINNDAIKGRLTYVMYITYPNFNFGLYLNKGMKGDPKVQLYRVVYLADTPQLASMCSDNGSDVVFEVSILEQFVREHIIGPGTYEATPKKGIIPIKDVLRILSSNPARTKSKLKDAGLDILVEEWESPIIKMII